MAALVPGAILLPGRGPADDVGDRVEAVASSTTSERFAADPAGPGISAETRAIKPPVQVVTVEDAMAQAGERQGPTDSSQLDGQLPDGVTTTIAGSTTGSADAATADTGTSADATATTVVPSSAETTAVAPAVAETTAVAAAPTAAAAPLPVAPNSQSAPGANKRELYVDGNSGSGSNPGTKDRPFRRPIEATTIAEPGTTIYLRAGTYDTNTHGAFSIRRSGTAENWIRIAPYPGERVELVAGGEYGSGFEFLGAAYVELSGFVLRGRDDSIHGNGVFIKDGAHDIRVIGNQIRNFGGGGVSMVGSSRVTIERNDVRDNAFRSHYQGSGISLFKPSGPVSSAESFTNVVRGNYVVHNYNAVRHKDGRLTDGNCIIMDRFDDVGYQGRTLIENNVCAENGGRGVHTYQSSNIVARNNTLYHNMGTAEITAGRGELTAGSGRNIVFYNNLVVNRPGVPSFINHNNQNTHFHNNHVASEPPPGDGNKLLPAGVSYFRSTDRGGPVDQFRPTGASGAVGAANADRQSSHDLSGKGRPKPGAVGALEP